MDFESAKLGKFTNLWNLILISIAKAQIGLEQLAFCLHPSSILRDQWLIHSLKSKVEGSPKTQPQGFHLVCNFLCVMHRPCTGSCFVSNRVQALRSFKARQRVVFSSWWDSKCFPFYYSQPSKFLQNYHLLELVSSHIVSRILYLCYSHVSQKKTTTRAFTQFG